MRFVIETLDSNLPSIAGIPRIKRIRMHGLAHANRREVSEPRGKSTGRTHDDCPLHAAEFSNVQHGYVTLTSNGIGKIVVSVGSFQATVDVTVKNVEQPTPISFRHDTLAILTKQGCNSGSCHSKPNGHSALELSLDAFDPQADERNLVRGGFGRLTHVIEPDESLMLKKPSLVVAHGGDKRLRKSDLPYRILRQWIAEGCLTDIDSSPSVVRVEVSPAEQRVIQLPDGEQQVSVRAHFTKAISRLLSAAETPSSANCIATYASMGVPSMTTSSLSTLRSRAAASFKCLFVRSWLVAGFGFIR